MSHQLTEPAADDLVRRRARSSVLSFAQERLWFIDAAAPGSVAYNVPLLLRWREAVDVVALRSALGSVLRRHEVLRTTYRLRDGRPVQVVGDPQPVSVEVVDMTGTPRAWRQVEAQAARRAREPFALAERPPIRCTVWRGLTDGDAMLLNIHHIAIDGWSLAVLFEDLAAAYETAARGSRPDLPEPAVQYADFAAWDRQMAASDDFRQLLAERIEQLRAVPSGLTLAGRQPVTAAEGARRGAQRTFRVAPGLWSDVHRLAGRLRVTPFVVAFAAFQAVLQRWSGQEEFLVGVMAADRPYQELEELVGFFVNTVPQRCRPRPGASFAELCVAVRAEAFECLTYQRIPFDRLTAELTAETRALVNIGFAFQNYPAPRYRQPPRWHPPALLPNGAAKFDLLFILDDGPGGVVGTVEYDVDCYPEAVPAGLAEHFQVLLSAAIADPGLPLSRLPITAREPRTPPPCVVSGPKRDLVARHLGPVDADTATVLDVIAARIDASDPAACAVTCNGAELTWGELDRWSWAVAASLHERGIGTGDYVPVIAGRGGALAVGWLGVLRSGAAYAPIGLDTPPQRLEHIIAQLGARVVLVDAEGAALVQTPGIARLHLEPLRGRPAEPAPPRLRGRDPAMVIHTSGSTGRPKGVVVPHQGLLNTTLWWIDDEQLGPADKLLCTCSTSFDVANFDAFRSLAAGSVLVLADDWQRRDPRALVELIRGPLGVTTTSMTPSMARATLEADGGGPTRLRTIYLAGEAVTRQLAGACAERWGAAVRNAYGPTEASCLSTCAPVDLGDERPPIGVPLPNTRAYVLGPRQEELPVGVPGELYVAGVGVALGYLGRPDLTDKAFLPDLYGADPQERMYRTGDRVVLRPDGMIDYIGRVDDQVKILGNRIEPNEVRRLLEEHPRVRAAAVIAVGEPKRLVAYLELDPRDGLPARDEIVEPLQRWLPTAVLPAQVYAVPALPFTQNDKVDSAALRSMPATLLPELPAGEVALSESERRAAQLFADAIGEATGRALGTAGLAPDADFFTLGGHSLLAVKVLADAERLAGSPLSLRDFLARPTVAGLGRLLVAAAEREGQAVGDAPDGQPAVADRYLASSAQQRFWFLDKLPALRRAYLMPTVIELTGPVDLEVLAGALNAVLRRHPALQSRFQLDRKLKKVTYSTTGQPPCVTVIDARGWDPPRLREHVSDTCWAPFDLACDAPARAEVIAADGRTLVAMTAHHIAMDGWSLAILMEQYADTYRAMAGRRPYQTAPAIHPGRLAARRAPAGSLSAMVEHLRDAPTDVALPFDRPRGGVQRTHAGTRSVTLPEELTSRLRDTGAELGVTTFMIAAAVLAAALARAGDQREFLFAFPWAGRETPGSAEAVGMFVNTLVLRVDLRGEPTWRELLARVRSSAIVCYRNAAVPFDALVAALHPDRDLSRPPLTPAYLAAFDAPLRLGDFGPGVTARSLPPEPLHIKYEFELIATDHRSRLEFAANYLVDLFDPATVKHLLGAVVAAAGDLAADLDAPCTLRRERA